MLDYKYLNALLIEYICKDEWEDEEEEEHYLAHLDSWSCLSLRECLN